MSVVPLFRTIVGGPASYPATPSPNDIEDDSSRWLQTTVELSSPYSHVFPLSSVRRRSVKLVYKMLSTSQFNTLKNFFSSVGGVLQAFNFTHPVSGDSFLARFQRPELDYNYDDDTMTYSLVMEVEETNG